MIETKVNTFTATIYVGTKVLNSDYLETGIQLPIASIEKFIQEWVNDVKICVTVKPTHFVYVDGDEFGLEVGFINYPRFPDTIENIKSKVLDLARELIVFCKQMRMSVVFPDETIMLSNV